MKKKDKMALDSINEKTNPILLTAQALMKVYAQATGAWITIIDHNYMFIPEVSKEVLSPKNICLFCIKHQKNIDVKNLRDLAVCPCR